MVKFKSIVVYVLLSILMIACSSPKDASKENFKKVINNYLKKDCIMLSTRNADFPLTIEISPEGPKWVKEKKLKVIKQYDALVSIGFLSSKDGSKEISAFRGMKIRLITVPTKIYSITEKGKRFFNGKNGFCAGTYQVDEINNFSEPSQAMGYTISNIHYTILPTNIADWATNPIISKAFPDLAKKIETKKSDSSTLVLMDNGWVHENDANW